MASPAQSRISDHADSYASRVVDVDPEVMKRFRLVLKLLVKC